MVVVYEFQSTKMVNIMESSKNDVFFDGIQATNMANIMGHACFFHGMSTNEKCKKHHGTWWDVHGSLTNKNGVLNGELNGIYT